jgi:hypothetical protein
MGHQFGERAVAIDSVEPRGADTIEMARGVRARPG